MMKLSRFLLGAALSLPLLAAAQPAPKVFVVDMVKVFEAHPTTKQQQSAFRAEEQKASDQLKKLEGEARALADKLKDQQTKFDDPTITATQKEAIRVEGQKIGQALQAKQAEGQQLLSKIQGDLQQRAQASRTQILQDIAKVAGEVARKKGGTLVYDRNSLVYADPAYDISNDVLAEVTKPGRTLPPPPATPAAPAAAKGAPAAPR
jgi:outer membrane protein